MTALKHVTPFDDSELLNYTQAARMKVYTDLTNDGSNTPDDPKTAAIVLATLKDMDKQVQTKQRLTVKKDDNETNKLIAQALARVGDLTGNVNPFLGNNGKVILGVSPDVNMLPSIKIVDGQDKIGDDPVNVKEFLRDYVEPD